MNNVVRVFKCNSCKSVLANHTREQIREHLQSHKGKKQEIKEHSITPAVTLSKRNIRKLARPTKSSLKQKLHKLSSENQKLKKFKKEHIVPADKKNKASQGFYDSQPWFELRYKVLNKYGRTCLCCGETKGQMHVDHIKPRSRYPELALDISNLQVLCKACNLGKSNKDETDFRESVNNF